MKAMILNSGIGKRMRPFTNENPKCFAKINGNTILEHEIDNITCFGINELIITTGPFEEKIKELIKNKYPSLKITYVKNPKYDKTNYIYSIWLAKDQINDDFILMQGDMVFEKKLLKKLLEDKNKNCVLVNNKIELPEKDFKGEIRNNVIKRIGVNVFGENAAFLAPIYKFSEESFKLWMDEIGKFVNRGDVNVYAENAFNAISRDLKLFPVYYENEFCMEIDNFDDLELARKFFKQRNFTNFKLVE